MLTLMPRIFLVDDDKDHLRTFTMILEEEGYSVDTYTDPVAALSTFKPNYYDLLVLDYRMPDLNGLHLYRRIKEKDPTARILIVTAAYEQLTEDEGDQIEEREKLRIIRKPISNGELLTEIKSSFT